MNACIIGDPVEHCILPEIIRLIAKRYGLNIVFINCNVENNGSLKEAINGLKALNFRGFDVTHPYKTEIIKYLDFIDDKAKRIGAVDTVIIKNGRLEGYNYNSYGAITSIEKEGRKILPSDKVVVIGAGGCARAVCFGVYEKTKKLIIINRFLDEAEKLKEGLISFGGEGVRVCKFNQDNLKREIVDSQFILHATPVGMNPNSSKTLVDKSIFNYLLEKRGSLNELICWDSIYSPLQTLFLKYAKENGAKAINGLGMLKNQLPLLIAGFYGEEIDLKITNKDLEKFVCRRDINGTKNQ